MGSSVRDDKLARGRQLQISGWNPRFNVGVPNSCLISKLRQSHSTPGSLSRNPILAVKLHLAHDRVPGTLFLASFRLLGFGEGWDLFISVLFLSVFTKRVAGLSFPRAPSSLGVLDLASPPAHPQAPLSAPLTPTQALAPRREWAGRWGSGTAVLPSTGTHTSCAKPSVVTGLKGQTAGRSGSAHTRPLSSGPQASNES